MGVAYFVYPGGGSQLQLEKRGRSLPQAQKPATFVCNVGHMHRVNDSEDWMRLGHSTLLMSDSLKTEGAARKGFCGQCADRGPTLPDLPARAHVCPRPHPSMPPHKHAPMPPHKHTPKRKPLPTPIAMLLPLHMPIRMPMPMTRYLAEFPADHGGVRQLNLTAWASDEAAHDWCMGMRTPGAST